MLLALEMVVERNAANVELVPEPANTERVEAFFVDDAKRDFQCLAA
jgi:hypothetical protein